jgi:8-oxo-dGTP diphosphatase
MKSPYPNTTPLEIPFCYYRTSIKALILDDEKRFLLTKDEDGLWDLPGGGLDWGEDSRTCLVREVQEEMGIPVTWVAETPCYFTASFSGHREKKWVSNILYLTKIEHLNFTPSNECVEMRFFSGQEAKKEKLYANVLKFIEMFKPERH